MSNDDKRPVESLIEAALEKLPEHDISTALEKLLEANRLDAKNVQVLNLIANCYYILGEFTQAESTWQKAIQVDPGNKIAAAKMRSFNSPSFQFWLKRYRESIRYIENKDYQAAVEMLQALMQENDGFISLYQFLGLCYLAQSNERAAHKAWKQGLILDKNNPQLMGYLSNKIENPLPFAEQKDIPVKVKTENMRTFTFPKWGRWAWIVSGAVCLLLVVQVMTGLESNRSNEESVRQMQDKIKYLSEKLEEQSSKAPKDEVVATSAQLHDEEENINKIEGSAYDSDKEKEYYNQGYKAYLEGDWKTARSNLSVVVDMATHSYINREALYYLARVYYLQDNFDQAENYYLQYLKEFPDSNYIDDSLFYLGCVYYKEGNIQQAKDTFTILQDVEPSNGYTSTLLFKKVMNQ